MGIEFGNIPIRIRKVVYYTLSSTEQRAWAKAISFGLPNLFKRTVDLGLPMIPGFAMTLWLMKWAPEEHRRCQRKDPKMYENDT